MKKHFASLVFPLLFIVCVNLLLQDHAVVANKPLYTKSRWIVNEEGKRVKFACLNWPSHLETLLAQGLDKQPVDSICEKITKLRFNCVRLTWPVALPTNETLASITIENRFKSLGLNEAIAGIRVHNPEFLKLTIFRAFQTVVSKLGEHNVMVILDNHVSKPEWCCNRTDGNGFFGDQYFDPHLWLQGLSKMATKFKDAKNVVGMSLRNELRGPNQTIPVWRKYMHEGAEAVHRANPQALVIVSGLQFDKDLSFLKQEPMNLSFKRKLVYEVHEYSSSFEGRWAAGNPNDVCGEFKKTFMNSTGFLLQQGFPLFLSEFGGNEGGTNLEDNRFLNCIFPLIAELDLDWALWTLQGSYYMRQGLKDTEETYGILTKDWSHVHNSTFMQRVHAIQPPFTGPGLPAVVPYNIIFHPSSGLCILKKILFHPLYLGPCTGSNEWSYSSQEKTIILKGTDFCVEAVGVGLPVKLGINCRSSRAKWEMISDSRLHLASKLPDGNIVCLDEYKGVIVTTHCRCLKGDPKCDPGRQWFKIVNTTRVL